MTEQEAIKNFQGENKILSQYAETKFQKAVFAKKIERNNIAIQALEKKIAKKPDEMMDLFGDIEYNCRVCGEIIEKNYYAYCPTCGQKLDWSEERMKKMNKEKVMKLLSEYAEKHTLSAECGSEYIMQDNQAQVDALELVSDIFDSMEEQNKGWIPVEERLPENGVRVLTCDNRKNMHVMRHYNFYKYPFNIGPEHEQYYMPKAWMPLPEPYKE